MGFMSHTNPYQLLCLLYRGLEKGWSCIQSEQDSKSGKKMLISWQFGTIWTGNRTGPNLGRLFPNLPICTHQGFGLLESTHHSWDKLLHLLKVFRVNASQWPMAQNLRCSGGKRTGPIRISLGSYIKEFHESGQKLKGRLRPSQGHVEPKPHVIWHHERKIPRGIRKSPSVDAEKMEQRHREKQRCNERHWTPETNTTL